MSGPLPRGRHHLLPEEVYENQRRRLLDGAAEALAEHGYAALTVRHVIEAAGVSRATFYANFTDKGKQHSFLNARCEIGHLQARGHFFFKDGTDLTGTVVKPCRVRGQ